MTSLPEGWEWDYDGTRWFYRYKPTGLIQFRFPKEGDEYPDFVDAAAPPPELAPEEKLESQQQMKRRGTLAGSRSHNDASRARRDGRNGSPAMRATGGPMSVGWEDDNSEDVDFFQPEAFMFLGGYTDVSPDVEDGVTGSRDRKGQQKREPDAPDLSNRAVGDPIMHRPENSLPGGAQSISLATTSPPPTAAQHAGCPNKAQSEPVLNEPVLRIETQSITETGPLGGSTHSPRIPLLADRERPFELAETTPFNPVGVIAEMATEITAQARIETHPDPVEMADNTVLAPVETKFVEVGLVELATHRSPVEQKALGTETQQAQPGVQTRVREDLATYESSHPSLPKDNDDRSSTLIGGPSSTSTQSAQLQSRATEGGIQRNQDTQPSLGTGCETPTTQHQFKIARKPTNAGSQPSKYQQHTQGDAPQSDNIQEDKASRGKPEVESPQSHGREESLVLHAGPLVPPKVAPTSMSPAPQPPQRPPKDPIEASAIQPFPDSPLTAPGQQASIRFSHGQIAPGATGPSDLRTGMGMPSSKPQPPNLSKFPSVLLPARGQVPQARPPSQLQDTRPKVYYPLSSQPQNAPPLQAPPHKVFLAYNPARTSAGHQTTSQGQGAYNFPHPGPIPQSQTPGPTQMPALGPRPGIQRVGTMPDMLPSQAAHEAPHGQLVPCGESYMSSGPTSLVTLSTAADRPNTAQTQIQGPESIPSVPVTTGHHVQAQLIGAIDEPGGINSDMLQSAAMPPRSHSSQTMALGQAPQGHPTPNQLRLVRALVPADDGDLKRQPGSPTQPAEAPSPVGTIESLQRTPPVAIGLAARKEQIHPTPRTTTGYPAQASSASQSPLPPRSEVSPPESNSVTQSDSSLGTPSPDTPRRWPSGISSVSGPSQGAYTPSTMGVSPPAAHSQPQNPTPGRAPSGPILRLSTISPLQDTHPPAHGPVVPEKISLHEPRSASADFGSAGSYFPAQTESTYGVAPARPRNSNSGGEDSSQRRHSLPPEQMTRLMEQQTRASTIRPGQERPLVASEQPRPSKDQGKISSQDLTVSQPSLPTKIYPSDSQDPRSQAVDHPSQAPATTNVQSSALVESFPVHLPVGQGGSSKHVPAQSGGPPQPAQGYPTPHPLQTSGHVLHSITEQPEADTHPASAPVQSPHHRRHSQGNSQVYRFSYSESQSLPGQSGQSPVGQQPIYLPTGSHSSGASNSPLQFPQGSTLPIQSAKEKEKKWFSKLLKGSKTLQKTPVPLSQAPYATTFSPPSNQAQFRPGSHQPQFVSGLQPFTPQQPAQMLHPNQRQQTNQIPSQVPPSDPPSVYPGLQPPIPPFQQFSGPHMMLLPTGQWVPMTRAPPGPQVPGFPALVQAQVPSVVPPQPGMPGPIPNPAMEPRSPAVPPNQFNPNSQPPPSTRNPTAISDNREPSGDSQSDRASTSTMDASEAQARPIMKPKVVNVVSRPVQAPNQQQGPVQTQPWPPNPGPVPTTVAATIQAPQGHAALQPTPNPAGQLPTPAPQHMPTAESPQVNPMPHHQTSQFTVAPLFSKPFSGATPSPTPPSNRASQVSTVSTVGSDEPSSPRPAMSAASASARDAPQRVASKWKKPAGDYSGGDWGDDDDWG